MRDEIENKASIQVLDVDASAIDATWTHQVLDHSIKVVVVGTLPCNLMQSSLIDSEDHMPTYKRIRAGAVAKQIGQRFEEILHNMCGHQAITCIRIPDGCKQARGPQGYKLLRVKSPFDFVLLKSGLAITVDAKTIDSERFTYSDIKQHQVQSLLNCAKNAHTSGYIVWHRPTDAVVFYSVFTLAALRPRTSLTPENGILLGPALKMDLNKLFMFKAQTLDSTGIDAETI